MSLGLFETNEKIPISRFDQAKKRYDDDSYFTKHGYKFHSEDTFDWMPQSTKVYLNEDQGRFGYKDISGNNWTGPSKYVLKDGKFDSDLFKDYYDTRFKYFDSNDRHKEFYPYINKIGYGRSNLHAGSLRDRPYAGTYSEIEAGNKYGDYTFTQRRRGNGYIYNVNDKDGNTIHSYSSPEYDSFGGALDWLEGNRGFTKYKNGGMPSYTNQTAASTEQQDTSQYSNLNGALKEFDGGSNGTLKEMEGGSNGALKEIDPSSVSGTQAQTAASSTDIKNIDINSYATTLNAKPLEGAKNWYQDDRGYLLRSPENPGFAYRYPLDDNPNSLAGWWYDDPNSTWTWSEGTGWLWNDPKSPGIYYHHDSKKFLRAKASKQEQQTYFTDAETGEQLFVGGKGKSDRQSRESATLGTDPNAPTGTPTQGTAQQEATPVQEATPATAQISGDRFGGKPYFTGLNPDYGKDGAMYTQALIPAELNGVKGYYTDGSRNTFVVDDSYSGVDPLDPVAGGPAIASGPAREADPTPTSSDYLEDSPYKNQNGFDYTTEDWAKASGLDPLSAEYSNVRKLLEEVDADKNSSISPEEFQSLVSMYDADGDGQLSATEYSNIASSITGGNEPTPTKNIAETISESPNPSLSLDTIDYKGLPAAEKDLLVETLEDAATKHDWQNMAAMEKYDILKGYLPNISSARLMVLAEQATDAQSAFNILVQGSLTKENEANMASADLAQAEMDSNLARYRNITDMLRGDRLSAERAGEGRGNNFADKLLLQAEMSAADKYEQLQNASKLSDAQRRYDAAMTGAGERAEAVKLLSDSTLANNVSQVALEEKTTIFQALQDRVNRQEDIADQLAQVLGSTQERTLPAVKMAELIIEQASQEGKMEIANAEEKRQAIIESARELMANQSLLQLLAEQLGDEALTLGAEYTAEQQDFVQRVQNLKNIPGLVNAIIDRVGADMFAVYTSMYEQIGAIWAAGVVAGLVDQDGYVIPDTAFAETTAGDSAFEELEAIQNTGSDGVEGTVDKGVDALGSLINGIFKNFGKDDG